MCLSVDGINQTSAVGICGFIFRSASNFSLRNIKVRYKIIVIKLSVFGCSKLSFRNRQMVRIPQVEVSSQMNF